MQGKDSGSMQEFGRKHPVLAGAGVSILALLSGSFSLAAVAIGRLREKRKRP